MGAGLVGGYLKCETWKTWDGKKCKVGKRGTGKRQYQTAGLENVRKGMFGKPDGLLCFTCSI